MEKKIRRYQSHRISSRDEANNEINKVPCSKDRLYMQVLLICTKDYLDKNLIFTYQDFIQLFQRFGLRNKDIIEFMIGFVHFYNSLTTVDNEHKINWVKQRECKQSNFGEKNMIINRLAHEYEFEMKIFYKQYAQRKFIDIQEKKDFLDDFTNKINFLKNQSQKKNLIQEEVHSNSNDVKFTDGTFLSSIPASDCDDQYDFDLFESFDSNLL